MHLRIAFKGPKLGLPQYPFFLVMQ